MKFNIQKNTLTIIECTLTSIDAIFQYFHQSKKTRHLYYQNDRICVDQHIVKQNISLHPTNLIQIHLIEETDTVPPLFEDLHVVYEDALFLIVNKGKNMLTHSDGINTEHTLSNLVKGYYVQHHIQTPVRPIHRLDKDTTGMIIFCKLPLFQPMLDYMLQNKQIQRQYYAFVKGILPQKKSIIDQPLGKDRHNAKKMRISPTGKEAKTSVYAKGYGKNMTFIECHLHTGRTHQIRVHLASINHPLLSDPLYGIQDARINRLALHAYRIILYHPLLQKEICVNCPLPQDMERLLQEL